ncbi:hypothetical protein FHW96_000001, partial [Novosphingobium sp. SG751A]|nr:hypothetical protein [Novosphingobium sp. SG751A]
MAGAVSEVRSGPVVCFGEVMLRFATPGGRVIADA